MTVRIWALITCGCLGFFNLLPNRSLQAQVIWAGGIDWNVLTFRPEQEELTPSLYGYGIDLSVNYAFLPAVEAGLFTSYEILNVNAAKFLAGKADHLLYGGELGVRLADSVNIAIRMGGGQLTLKDDRVEEDYLGRWDANLYGVRLGGFWSTKRHRYIQVGLSYLNGFVTQESDSDHALVERRVDMLSLYVTYLIMDNSSGIRPFTLY